MLWKPRKTRAALAPLQPLSLRAALTAPFRRWWSASSSAMACELSLAFAGVVGVLGKGLVFSFSFFFRLRMTYRNSFLYEETKLLELGSSCFDLSAVV